MTQTPDRPERTAGFPGSVFNAEGASFDAAVPNLTPEKLHEYPHRSMVVRDGAASVARMWLLSDDATFVTINPLIVAEAVKMVLAGEGIVILGRRPEPVADVRDGLLDALDLLGPSKDVAGRE